MKYGFRFIVALATTLFFAPLVLDSCNEPPPQEQRTVPDPQEKMVAYGAATGAFMRQYPSGGTFDLEKVYHVNRNRDKILKDLGYTEQAAKDSFPAFAAYWTARGWPTSELLNLYEFECAWNDAVWITDTYIGIGIYIRPNFVTQSRGWIIAPDGWFHVRFGCMTGLGRYTGKHANVYSDQSGANPGCTPGTAIQIDHAGWMTSRQPQRNCIWASCWGMDYGQVGGMAYSEGVIIEYFRLVGGRNGLTTDPSFISNGVTMSHPGENSVVRYCMSEGFNNAGYAIIGGTPGLVDVCSAFYNCGPGFDLLGNNGLTNLTLRIPSGDNNRGGLIRSRPMDSQSVGGGSFTVISPKSESRGVLQRLFVSEGALGQLNLNILGGTADYNGVQCPELISIEKGSSWAVSVIGIQYSSGVQSLLYHAESGKRLTGGQAFVGNSFGINYEGLYLKSFANMSVSGVMPGCSWVPGVETCGACVNGTQTCTTPYVLSIAGCTGAGAQPPPVTRTQACGTPPPTANTAKAFAQAIEPAGSGILREAKYMVDGNPNTFWMGQPSMTGDGKQWVIVTKATAASQKGLSFTIPNGYTNSYPRTFTVELSTDGVTFGAPKSYTTTTQPSSATWPAQVVKAARVSCTAQNNNYWGISEFTWQ